MYRHDTPSHRPPYSLTFSSSLLTVSPSSLSSRRPVNLWSQFFHISLSIHTHSSSTLYLTCSETQLCLSSWAWSHLCFEPWTMSNTCTHTYHTMATCLTPPPTSPTTYQCLVLVRRRGLTSPSDESRPLGMSLQGNVEGTLILDCLNLLPQI